MLKITTALFVISLVIVGVFIVLFPVYSYFENEKRAFRRGVVAVIIYVLLLAFIANVPTLVYTWFLLSELLIILVLLAKFGNTKVTFKLPAKRFDERDVMFSRNTLKEGSEKFKAYYEMRPEHKASDDLFRTEPGLMSKDAALHNELLFNAAHATFQTVDLLQPLAEKSLEKSRTNLSDDQITSFLKNWTIKLGALDVGFASVENHHVYSHTGRGETYGNKVELKHKYAIAFTVEMNHESLSYNPKGPVLMESAQQYLNAGQIAVQVAQFLRNLGIDARAHIDANYRLVCPIVAQDAGLGVIGRMGLLMTSKHGPRVRIGVVTTDMKLPVNNTPLDYSAIHFCNICKKCAVNCPSKSISEHSVSGQENTERWTINHEKCFTFWCKIGTDCGRCVAVCPYSHPDNFMHNIVRWMIRRNPVNRWLALKLDDFFYGRIPQSSRLKNWMKA